MAGPTLCVSSNFSYILTGIISWGIGCGLPGVPGIYASVQEALCFIDYDTKCKHGQKYSDYYDYPQCENWIDKQDFLKSEIIFPKSIAERAKKLMESCIIQNQ